MDRSNQVIKATTAIVMTIAMVGIVRAEKDNDAAVAPPTWADPSTAHTLKSEEEKLAAEAARFVTIGKASECS